MAVGGWMKTGARGALLFGVWGYDVLADMFTSGYFD